MNLIEIRKSKDEVKLERGSISDLINHIPLMLTITSVQQIPKLDISEVTYSIFFENFMLGNKPCVLTNIGNDWQSRREWLSNGKPNFEYLTNMYGDVEVPIANCEDKYYNAQKKEVRNLKNFMDYWNEYCNKGYPTSMNCLYLKDWHFTRDFPNDAVYRVPHVFASDWLNEYYTSKNDIHDDYRFVYMGPKGSWTPFHADVFTSFSWSVNICGCKRWRLFYPGHEDFLKDNHGNLVYDIESGDLENRSKYPNYNKVSSSYEVIQNALEAIFVPSGWHHQVWNMEDTISINHNWINACNIRNMWLSLCKTLSAVKSEIADCKDMDNWAEQCQLILNATYGIDFPQFYDFLRFIAQRRIDHCKEKKPLVVYGQWELGIQHILFDLTQIKGILLELLSNKDFTDLSCYNEESVNTLLYNINLVIYNEDL